MRKAWAQRAEAISFMFYNQSHEKIVEPYQTTQNIPDEENEKEVNDQNDESDFDDDL